MFRAYCGEDDIEVDLESPTSVVPVFNSQIIIIMTEACAPPVIPVGQAREFIQKSRQVLYRNYKRSPVVIAEQKQKIKQQQQQQQQQREQTEQIQSTSKYSDNDMKEKQRQQQQQRSRPTPSAKDHDTISLAIGAKPLSGKSLASSSQRYSDEPSDSYYESADSNQQNKTRTTHSGTSDSQWSGRSGSGLSGDGKVTHRVARGSSKADGMNEVFSSATELGSSLADAAGILYV